MTIASHGHAPRTLRHLAAAALVALGLCPAAPARAAVEGQYDPDTTAGPPMTTWWIRDDPASRKADQDYVSGMRPHHAGALSMSREYLADPRASSPVLRVLAQAIIRNQAFEIELLDEVARNLAQPPRVLDLGLVRIPVRPAATEGLAQRRRFLRSPIPSLLDALSDPGRAVTERDVQFAKAMMVHHQAAVEMANGYLGNKQAGNGYLGLLNIDIAWDQSQEIALMRRVVAQYPGDAAAVRVDRAMMHGMEGMGHAGGHEGHGGLAPQPEPPPRPAGGHAHHH